MKYELTKTLEILKMLNENCDSSIIKAEEFEEQEENIVDFSKLMDDFNEILKSFNSSSLDNKIINEKLVHLHLKFSDCIWHFEQLHELVKRMAGKYPD